MMTSGRPLRRGEYSQTLGRLARYVLSHKALVVTAWVSTAVVLAVLFPQLETVVRAQSVDPIPAGVPSFRALDRMGDAFGEKGAKTTVFVTMEDPAGLTEPVRRRYDNLVARLQHDRDNVQAVRDLLADPITARQAFSEDKKAWYLPVGVSGTLGGPKAADAVESLRRTAAQAFAGTDTTVHVTGPTATFTDQIAAAEKDLVLITLATVLLIAVILLVVYRSIFTAMLPLLVIGISLAVGRGVLSALGELGMPVSQFTVAFMTVILLGAGVDYSVFLVSRYHERLRRGADPADALVDATATIGRVILASATTVALAFMAMIFGQLSVFATLGPACAVAIAVGFIATVTLLPPVLLWAARFGWGCPSQRPDPPLLEPHRSPGRTPTGTTAGRRPRRPVAVERHRHRDANHLRRPGRPTLDNRQQPGLRAAQQAFPSRHHHRRIHRHQRPHRSQNRERTR